MCPLFKFISVHFSSFANSSTVVQVLHKFCHCPCEGAEQLEQSPVLSAYQASGDCFVGKGTRLAVTRLFYQAYFENLSPWHNQPSTITESWSLRPSHIDPLSLPNYLQLFPFSTAESYMAQNAGKHFLADLTCERIEQDQP
jgi:hypothetical protein